jgi:hypothetical protein
MNKQPSHEAHPIAELFPMLDDDEIAALAHDIKANGLRLPIVLDADGRILDGRNRLAACTKAKVAPVFVTYDGDAPELFVISANVHRRHMTIGQRAMITAIALDSVGKRRNGRWTRGSVPASSGPGSNGWPQRMAEAGMVLDANPALADDVVAGKVSLNYAAIAIRPRPETKQVDVKITPGEPNVILTPDIRLVDSEERLEEVTSRLEDGVEQLEFQTDELLAEASATVAAEDAPAGAAPAAKKTRTSDLNPAQLKEKRAARESADEEALAVITPLCGRIWGLDASLHEIGLAELTGKARWTLVDDLERFAKTIDWALLVLRGMRGE